MKTICGVDVSKAKLDACVMPGAMARSFDNDAAGIAELAAFCRAHATELVVMEATGGFERRAFVLLWEDGLPCAATFGSTPRPWGCWKRPTRSTPA